MGQCYGKGPIEREPHNDRGALENGVFGGNRASKNSFTVPRLPSTSPLPTFNSPLPSTSSVPIAGLSPARSTPRQFLKKPFPPPSPAKHIQASLLKRYGSAKPKEEPIPEGIAQEKHLNNIFGYSRSFSIKYELGEEIGRGHFGYTCSARVKRGEMKGQVVAVKVIAKAKMTTSISIEDVKREVKILKALSGHENLVQFFDAYEDDCNVYIVMEQCEGGELLDRILSRGGKYLEEDAKVIVLQILNAVSFCHLQGVVHRDLKPENFLFTTKEEIALMKAIDFGLSDFANPEERLNDIVGSAYYVAPEVLHRSYGTEADVWSVGVITYILLSGSRPFWARTESGIFRTVIRTDPSFDEIPWPNLSLEAKDFVKRLLHKDYRKRMTAAQALTHPWLRASHNIPLDILIFKLVKAYLRSSSLKRAALKALSRTLKEDDLVYLRAQFILLEPNKDGRVNFDNFRAALLRYSTDAMKEARTFDILKSMDALSFKKLDFQEFCAAAISVHQMEALENWEQYARMAYEYFEKDGNRIVNVEELAREVGISATVQAHVLLHDWVRNMDGKLSFTGFVKLLHGVARPQ